MSSSTAESVRAAAKDARTLEVGAGPSDAAPAAPAGEGGGAQEKPQAATGDAGGATGPSDAAPADGGGGDAAAQPGEHPVSADGGDGIWPRQRPPMPYEIVRSLQFLQDQVARGNASAIRVQAMLLRRYGPSFLDADPSVWKDPRNLRAAALFVLSGGPPSVLRRLLSRLTPQGDDKTLLEGSLAYVENRIGKALELLSSLDLEFVEPGLACQIDLAVAQMEQETKPQDALDRLSRVMLRAPGTLLEEAALRLGVLLAEKQGEHDLADRYARQYFDRYAQSAYAGNFRARFAAVYSERPAGTEDATVATIADATARIPLQERLDIFLAVARRALVTGNLKLAAKASGEAVTFAVASKQDRERARLYRIASTVPEHPYGEARAMLEAIDPGLLHPADRKLRDAAFDVLDQIRMPVDVAATAAAASAAPVANAGMEPPASAVLERGQALLKAIGQDMKDSKP